MLLGIALLMLLLSAMFSGSEIAFVTASKLKVELKKKDGSNRARKVAYFFDNPAHFIGSLLVGNNVVLVVFTYTMTKLLSPLLEPFIPNEFALFILITLFLTIVVLLFGEYLPKTVFRLYANTLLFALAYPLRFFQWIFAAPSRLMNWLSQLVLTRGFGLSQEREIDVFTRHDLKSFVLSANTNEDENIQQELFENALYLQDVKVKECIVPRTEIISINKDESPESLIQLFKESKHSRIIVVEDTIDDVIGYVHHIKLMEDFNKIEDITLPIIIVPETLKMHDLLNKFIIRKQSIACVVDEFGSVTGLITMEDVLEELFGEIEDEHDHEEEQDLQLSEKEFLFSGRNEIDKINKKYEILKIPDGDYNTLSGYVVITTGRIPEEKDEIELEGKKFIIEQVSDKKIEQIRVIILDEDLDD